MSVTPVQFETQAYESRAPEKREASLAIMHELLGTSVRGSRIWEDLKAFKPLLVKPPSHSSSRAAGTILVIWADRLVV